MPNDTVPSGLPFLAKGTHASPEDGACLMEYVSIIKGVPFSDYPEGVPADISAFGQWANDAATDEQRQELAPLIARIASAKFIIDSLGPIELYELLSRYAPGDANVTLRTMRAGDICSSGRLMFKLENDETRVEIDDYELDKSVNFEWFKKTLEYALDTYAPLPESATAPAEESINA